MIIVPINVRMIVVLFRKFIHTDMIVRVLTGIINPAEEQF
jgi:hypothetical protein